MWAYVLGTEDTKIKKKNRQGILACANSSSYLELFGRSEADMEV
jgi:hypothetical protein